DDFEKELFIKLLGISGIGPKAATNILSNISAEDLVASIKSGDLIKKKIPGIGPKTAARIVTELKDKLDYFLDHNTLPKERYMIDDIISALLNLGYTKAEIDKNLSKIEDIISSTENIEFALRDSLKIMKK
ncbi:MAG: Holliday junction branch migration protein RuvA, partial [Thermodesulfobacteriota bacterium]